MLRSSFFRLALFFAMTMVVPQVVFATSKTPCEADRQETFAEYLFRYKVLSTKDGTLAIREAEYAENLSDLERLWKNMKRLGVQSPLRARVCYAAPYEVDPFKVMKGIAVQKSDDLYKSATSVRNYIELSIGEIQEALSEGYRESSLAFEQTQQRKDFIERITLTNEAVRVCGITKDIEQHVVEKLKTYLAENGMTPLEMFFFGSRVMPRTELIVRDPLLDGVLPVAGRGVMKNTVRISGLTRISDLEIMLIFSSEQTLEFYALKAIGKRFRRYLEQSFRDFPVSVKFIQANKDDNLADPFAFVSKCRLERPEYCDKPLSRFQFAPVLKSNS